LKIDSTQPFDIVKRLRHLGKTKTLFEYSWDGKESGMNISDAQIMMHLFCSFMDEKISLQQQSLNYFVASNPFTAIYFTVATSNLDEVNPHNPHMVIYQTKKNPPHFDLMVNNGGDKELWEIKEGPMNLFYCLAIFINYFVKNHRGYLDRTYLGSEKIQLIKVVS